MSKMQLISLLAFALLIRHAEAKVYDPGKSFPQDDAGKVSCMNGHPVAGYGPIPGCTMSSVRAGREFRARFNQHGLRGPDYPPKAPPGWKRVLLVGSSIYVGPGLPEEQTIAKKLEHKLRAIRPKTEVINVSVEGYSTVHLASRMKEWISSYNPDLILFHVSHQAFATNPIYAHFSLFGPDGLPTKVYLGPAETLPEWIQRALGNPLTLRNRMASTLIFFWYRLKFFWRLHLLQDNHQAAAKSLEPTIDLLSALNQLATKSRIKFFYFFTNFSVISNNTNVNLNFDFRLAQIIDWFTPEFQITLPTLNDALERAGIPHFGVRPAKRNQLLQEDYHLSEEGSEWIAEDIYRAHSQYLAETSTPSGSPAAPRRLNQEKPLR